MGTSVTKLRLFFHKVVFIINTIVSSLHVVLYAGGSKLFTGASELFVLQLVVFRKTSSECVLSGGQKHGSLLVLNQDCREDEGEQSTPLLQVPPLCTGWCVAWRFHAGVGLGSLYSWAKAFEFVIVTSLTL